MAYPSVARIELPILLELVATGGVEDVRFLYDRLTPYSPQLGGGWEATAANGETPHSQWRFYVQRAGRALDEKREIERRGRGLWTITARGRKRVADEDTHFSLSDRAEGELAAAPGALSHEDVQRMLVELGRVLGHYAQTEFEYYDVIWRISERSPRITHVFEVQHKGSVDAALVKLKRAYEAQRSRPFLLVASERDTNRALRELSAEHAGAFHEIGRATTILSFAQLSRLHGALTSVEPLLKHFLD
ncbi:MAG TPA: hypothetical protein VM870_10620 [Pyrinomonadaceae bacterium]|nr:hypothetical protein [Pyrinomonadaceae bacterium]